MQQKLQNKKNLVSDVFDKVYDKYDLMNNLMSFGIHKSWKKATPLSHLGACDLDLKCPLSGSSRTVVREGPPPKNLENPPKPILNQ